MAYSYYAAAASRPKYSDTGGVQYDRQGRMVLGPNDYPAQENGQEVNYGDVASDAFQGMAIGAKYTAPKGTFETDRAAGLKASGEGYASGGPIAAGVAGATAQIGQYENVRNAIQGVQTGVQGYSEINGRPTYLGGDVGRAQRVAKDLDKAADPGWSIESFFSPSSNLVLSLNQGEARRTRRKLRKGIRGAQEDYNRAYLDYAGQSIAELEYQRRNDPNRRMTNLYNYG